MSSPAHDALDLLEQILLVAPVLLFSMVAHEYAHGYAAMKQGDLTAYQLGRLTFNPVKHIDPVMTILLPLMLALMHQPIFGGAKPVPVNPNNYRHYKRGDIIVSLAGIVTNLAIAALCIPLIVLVGLLARAVPAVQLPTAILQQMFITGIALNLLLAFFNLMPIPPLDGSHVFKYVLPLRLAIAYQRLGAFGFLILFALLSFGRPLLLAWLSPAFIIGQRASAVYCSFIVPQPTCQ